MADSNAPIVASCGFKEIHVINVSYIEMGLVGPLSSVGLGQSAPLGSPECSSVEINNIVVYW